MGRLFIHRRRQTRPMSGNHASARMAIVDLFRRVPAVRLPSVDTGPNLGLSSRPSLTSAIAGSMHDSATLYGRPLPNSHSWPDDRACLLQAASDVGGLHFFHRLVDALVFLLAIDDPQVPVVPEAAMSPCSHPRRQRSAFALLPIAITRHISGPDENLRPRQPHLRAGNVGPRSRATSLAGCLGERLPWSPRP